MTAAVISLFLIGGIVWLDCLHDNPNHTCGDALFFIAVSPFYGITIGMVVNFLPLIVGAALAVIGTATQMAPSPATSCEQVAKFDFPILLVHGERSPKNFFAMSAALRKCRDVPEPIVITNAAHGMMRDNPAAFNAVLADFLKRNEGTQ